MSPASEFGGLCSVSSLPSTADNTGVPGSHRRATGQRQRSAGEITTSTLSEYRRHAELFGPELVVETAARDLDERQLVALRSYVQHLERVGRWHRGRWQERRRPARACVACGLDLPADASSRMQLHPHCRERLKRRRQRQRDHSLSVAPQPGNTARPARRDGPLVPQDQTSASVLKERARA